MRFVFRALRNPTFENLLLLLRQRTLCGFGWHLVVVLGKDAADQFALVRPTRNNRHLARFGGFDGIVADVQAQLALARVLILTMTFQAMTRENRADIAEKINFLAGRFRSWTIRNSSSSDEQERGCAGRQMPDEWTNHHNIELA